MNNSPEPLRNENTPTTGTREEALTELAYLWKCDDPVWVAQREADWLILVKAIYHDYPKVERRPIEHYFKYGELLENISVWSLFFLTPYNSEKSLLQVFNSNLLDSEDRSSMFSSYIFDADRFSDCSWYEKHTALFVETMLGNTYCEVIEQTSLWHSKIISPPPTLWCHKFIRHATKSLVAHTEWKPWYECVSYFISTLPYAIYERDRKRIKLPKLLQLVRDGIENNEFSGRALAFAQELKSREQEIWQAWDTGEQKIAVGLEVSNT